MADDPLPADSTFTTSRKGFAALTVLKPHRRQQLQVLWQDVPPGSVRAGVLENTGTDVNPPSSRRSSGPAQTLQGPLSWPGTQKVGNLWRCLRRQSEVRWLWGSLHPPRDARWVWRSRAAARAAFGLQHHQVLSAVRPAPGRLKWERSVREGLAGQEARVGFGP